MAEETKSAIASQLLNTLPNSQPDDSFYTLIVNGDNQGFDAETRYIPLDYVSSVSVSASTEITSYPLLSGDVISDHKYDNPRTVEISGKFALNGKIASQQNAPFSFSGDKGSRLKNIEEYFFALRKYGKFISLVSVINNQNRFSTIDNLAISNIRFTRQFNVLEFSLSLKEIYCYENENELDLLESVTDPDMPSLAGFKTLDFAKDVLTYEGIEEMTIEKLADNSLIEASFGDALGEELISTSTSVLVGGITAALVYIILKKLVQLGLMALAKFTMYSASLTIAGAIPVIGWIALGVGILAAGITFLCKWLKKKSLIDTFKGYSNAEQNAEERQRFMNVVNNIKTTFNKLAKNNNIKFYGFTSNVAKQSAYLTIDNNIYEFKAEKISTGWSLQVLNASENDEAVPTTNTSRLVGHKSLLGLKSSDSIFHTTNKTYIYILNKALLYEDYDDETLQGSLEDAWKTGKLGFMGYTDEEMKSTTTPSDLTEKFLTTGIYQDLTQFVFVITNVKLTELEDALEEAMYNCFKKESYE